VTSTNFFLLLFIKKKKNKKKEIRKASGKSGCPEKGTANVG
jgi:hypothetical protein